MNMAGSMNKGAGWIFRDGLISVIVEIECFILIDISGSNKDETCDTPINKFNCTYIFNINCFF